MKEKRKNIDPAALQVEIQRYQSAMKEREINKGIRLAQRILKKIAQGQFVITEDGLVVSLLFARFPIVEALCARISRSIFWNMGFG